METRLTELEIRYMRQEKTIQELYDAVWRQEKILQRLERDLRLLREQVNDAIPSIVRDISDEEPPPHY